MAAIKGAGRRVNLSRQHKDTILFDGEILVFHGSLKGVSTINIRILSTLRKKLFSLQARADKEQSCC